MSLGLLVLEHKVVILYLGGLNPLARCFTAVKKMEKERSITST
jgi:hypothetical protein